MMSASIEMGSVNSRATENHIPLGTLKFFGLNIGTSRTYFVLPLVPSFVPLMFFFFCFVEHD